VLKKTEKPYTLEARLGTRSQRVSIFKEAKYVRKFGVDTPRKRPAQPEEIAPRHVFLGSPQRSSDITGDVLPIIGGDSGG
jgi:NAD(P)-dependent dehydrogenase (short-subunit alcohol dehydrogenase family)